MLLSELINGDGGPAGKIEIRGLTADSRAVRPGYLFAALRGSRADGSDFVADAVAHGAIAVLAAEGARIELPEDKVRLVTDANPRRRLALMAARFHPAQPRVIAAVTGTNGKTSVAAFARQIWERMGVPAASLGTLGIVGRDVSRSLSHTTPDPVTLHQALSDLAAADIDHLAIEASSHGLDQCRLDGVRVSAAAFTNLTQDHLDYHPSAEAYLAAKLRLFDTVMAPGGVAVLNADAPEFARLAEVCRARGHRIMSYGRTAGDLRLVGAGAVDDGQRLTIDVAGRRRTVALPLPGAFQAMNALCAAGLVVACGVAIDDALAALSGIAGVPGRVECVARHPCGAPVYVDYAHTPDALAHVLEALRPHARGRLVVVFGCGGDRDRTKRPLMGKIAAALADHAIVTDDNPRGEDPGAIRRAVLAACPGADEVDDRARAIREAIARLAPGDVLVIAGKGHERGQIVGQTVIPFDDAEIARAAVAGLRGDDR
ncbi:MAG: UDP-N-acetylmuramoyl-L-alanyl-D-glutamate--2,6-diaminopimelate ligase [Alphaproteobacteria bacterium]